jgi:hypothetical protein
MQSDKQIWTTEDLADHWHVNVAWIYRNREVLQIPYFKLGTQYRYRKSEIKDFEDRNAAD